MQAFDKDQFDFVSSHGFGGPTTAGFKLGESFVLSGDDYATAAYETVFRGLTTESA